MRCIFVLLSLASVQGQFVDRPTAPPTDLAKKYPKIPNEWIVVFHPEATSVQMNKHHKALEGMDGLVKFKYNATKGFRGYHIVVDSEKSAAMSFVRERVASKYDESHEVHYIEQNAVVRASGPRAECNTQTQATWGIVRVGASASQANKIDGLYTYPAHGGTDVKVYVMDTGIYRDNVDFQGRAIFGADFTTNNPPKTDLQGHGTHVAGTVIGNKYGVDKYVTAVDVRVLGASGSGTTAGVIAGVDYTAAQGAGKKSIGSMSLGGGKSTALDSAVNSAVDAGVTMIVAAGNEAMDACNVSPAAATKAITVACSDNTDSFCYFSNYGSCTDIIAPGMSITSAWIGSRQSDNTISGTSMSAPHVSGVAAHIQEMSSRVLTPTQVKSELMAMASKNVISSVVGRSTPNVLLQSLCVGAYNSTIV